MTSVFTSLMMRRIIGFLNLAARSASIASQRQYTTSDEDKPTCSNVSLTALNTRRICATNRSVFVDEA